MGALREANLRQKLESFGVAVGPGLGTTDLEKIAKSAVQGGVLDLLIEDGRRAPGRVDHATGEVEMLPKKADTEHTPDVLDDLSEMVFRQNGRVWLVPYERMPSTTGAAAILRF
jgi:hypothetical protein